MTALLQEAITELSKLPADEQERMGRWLLDEIAAEQRWDAAFRGSSEKLNKLAAEARADLRAGRATELDPDSL